MAQRQRSRHSLARFAMPSRLDLQMHEALNVFLC